MKELTCPQCGEYINREDVRALVEAAVRATVEACAAVCDERLIFATSHAVRSIDPAPIVARVLGDKS